MSLYNEPVITKIENFNKRSKGESMIAIHFRILHKKIPHSNFLKTLYELTDFCFVGGCHKNNNVYRFGATWVSHQKNYLVFFDKSSFKKAIKFVWIIFF